MKPRVKRSNRHRLDGEETIPFIVRLLASGFYTGYVPVLSGTLASFVALLLPYTLGFYHWTYLLPVCVLFFIIGTHYSGIMEKVYGKDPAEVTIDEFVGMWVSLLFLPKTMLVALTAFLLFRCFDIFKPFPIQTIDKYSGGLTIMLDDVVAGIYANSTLHIMLSIPIVHSFLMSL